MDIDIDTLHSFSEKPNSYDSNNLILTNETSSMVSSLAIIREQSNEMLLDKMFDLEASGIKEGNAVELTDVNNMNNLNNLNSLNNIQNSERPIANGFPAMENDLTLVNSNNTLVSTINNVFEDYNISDANNRNIPNLTDYYNTGKILGDFSWDFRFDSFNNLNGDSTTLGSSSRASHEFFENSYFDIESQLNQDEIDSNPTRTTRFTASLSNSLSNIFKNNNNKFTLRAINPLSTHKDPNALVKTLPNLVENVENLSIEHSDEMDVDEQPNQRSKKKKCLKNSHLKNCQCNNLDNSLQTTKKSKRNVVSAITYGRLGNSNNNSNSHSAEKEIKLEDVKLTDESSTIISLADLESSYTFDSSISNPSVKSEGESESPDYAALFSDVTNHAKKRSKTISFKKKPATQPALSEEDVDNLVDQNGLPIVLPSGIELPVIHPPMLLPINEPTRRGRKPSLAYDASKTFVCTYCQRRFRRQEHLKRHFRSLHTNEKPFDCELCGKKFSRSDNLAQHIKTHSNSKQESDIELEMIAETTA